MRLEDVILRDTRANQPVATAVAAGTIYFVTDELAFERSNGTIWQDITPAAVGGAPDNATYIVQVATGTLSAEQALGALGTGLLKSTTTTGVLSIAVADTDYAAATHAARHLSGGADAIKIDDLAAGDDNTDLNVSTSKHGLAPKLSNVATEFLSGTGVYSVPAGGGGSDWDVEIVKAVDEDEAGTTLQNDDELFFPVALGEVWFIDFLGIYSGDSVTADMKIQATFPTSRGVYSQISILASSNAVSSGEVVINGATTITQLSVGTNSGLTAYSVFRFEILLYVAAGPGNFQVQFAAVNAGTARMAAGSVLRAKQLK